MLNHLTLAFVLKVKSLGSKPQNWSKKGLFRVIFRSILGKIWHFFAKSRRKLRTKSFEAHFHRKLRTLQKCSNVKKLRTAEPQPISILVLLKKKRKKIVIKTHVKLHFIGWTLAIKFRSKLKAILQWWNWKLQGGLKGWHRQDGTMKVGWECRERKGRYGLWRRQYSGFKRKGKKSDFVWLWV